MDYEFYCDQATQEYSVTFNSEHEFFGLWLIDTLSQNDTQRLAQLNHVIEQLMAKKITSWRLEGSEISLELTQDEAHVLLNHTARQEAVDDDSLDEALSYQALESFCGLDDFQGLIQSWGDFLGLKT